MTTTPTTRVTQLARRMRVEVDTATYPASAYNQLMGIEELKLIEELRAEPDEVYEDAGAMREQVTGYAWRIEVKIKHSTNAAGTSVDTVHAFLRTQFNLLKTTASTASAEFGVRWYDRNGVAGDSFEGRVYVKDLPHDGGGGGAQDTVTVVLQGQGALTPITNPAGSLLPAVYSVSPTGGAAAGGTVVQINGYNFSTVTGAAGVKFGGTNATAYTIVSDSLIVAVAPAHAAGSTQVLVTNPTGPSPDTTADDYLYA